MKKFDIDSYHLKFRILVIKHFEFLTKYFGFKITSEKRKPYVFSYRIIYKNKTTAVQISYDVRDDGITILILRLLDGHIPEYELFIDQNTTINSYYLDDIMDIRSTSPQKEFVTIYHDRTFPPVYNDKTMEEIVTEYSIALKKYAKDILIGDFRIFNKLEKIVKKRAKQYEEEDENS